jgi:tRNA dimethylallyltransferase
VSKIIFVCGPTCSGKSGLAIRLAKHLDGVVINADSAQLYNALHILTASPTLEDKHAVPHLLYNFLFLTDRCSVVRYLSFAANTILTTLSEGRVPIVVGGSGLYISSLLFGIHNLPEISPEIRAEARSQIRQLGSVSIYEKLRSVDPTFAAKISPSDTYRLSRGYEVFLETGKGMSSFLQSSRFNPLEKCERRLLVLSPSRDALDAACSARFDAMLSRGVLEEVKPIVGGPLQFFAQSIIGFRELVRYLSGDLNLSSASELAKLRTRQYAKRQMTWFCNQIKDCKRVSRLDFDEILKWAS